MRTEQPFAKKKKMGRSRTGEGALQARGVQLKNSGCGVFRDHIRVPVKGVSLKQREKEETEAAGFGLP